MIETADLVFTDRHQFPYNCIADVVGQHGDGYVGRTRVCRRVSLGGVYEGAAQAKRRADHQSLYVQSNTCHRLICHASMHSVSQASGNT